MAALKLISFLLIVTNVWCETYDSDLGTKSLGTAFEFKINVDPGNEDCYYQMVETGASLYVSFQVMRGGDGNAGFYVNDPKGMTILPYKWGPHSELDEAQVVHGGYYALCIDNKPSTFKGKLVSLYLASFKRDQWEKYIEELTREDQVTQNATNLLRNVDMNIGEMMRYLEQSKQQHSYDSYVQNWSILQCAVVVISSIVQVYFVRKLFQIKNPSKVRA